MTEEKFDEIVSHVCDVVNTRVRRKPVNPSEVFLGGKPTIAQSVARKFVQKILHDSYGLSYADIESMTGCCGRNVREAVYVCRALILFDPLYKAVRSDLSYYFD